MKYWNNEKNILISFVGPLLLWYGDFNTQSES